MYLEHFLTCILQNFMLAGNFHCCKLDKYSTNNSMASCNTSFRATKLRHNFDAATKEGIPVLDPWCCCYGSRLML